ncbi:MAG: hypothetical protein GY810_25925 [Aureispira sp.]|nr:hypothetical protein [Aureispira sp.]
MKYIVLSAFLLLSFVNTAQIKWDITYTQVDDMLKITFKGQPQNNKAAECIGQNWLQYLDAESNNKAVWFASFESNYPTTYPKKTGVKVASPLTRKELHVDREDYSKSYFVFEQLLQIKPDAEGYKIRGSISYDDVQDSNADKCGFFISTLKCFKISSEPGLLVSKTACEYIQKD